MAGIHNDESTHRIVSGEVPTVGLRVFTNNLDRGVITQVATTGKCGYYCEAWHTVTLENGGETIMNCDRLATTSKVRQAEAAGH